MHKHMILTTQQKLEAINRLEYTPEEFINQIKIDNSVPVVKELSDKQIIKSFVNPQETQIQQGELYEEGEAQNMELKSRGNMLHMH